MASLLVYLVGVLLGGALLSVPVFGALRLAGLEPLAFHEVVFRTLELGALAGAALWLHVGGGSSRAGWGLARPLPRLLGSFGAGLLLGLVTLALLVLLLLGLGVRPLRAEASWALLWPLLLKGLLIGLAVSSIEELWFRGGLYGALLRTRAAAPRPGLGYVLVLTSILFAAVHFVRPDRAVAAEDLQWWSGLYVVAHSFHRFADPGIIDSFAALFAAGLVLGVVRHRSGAIAACVGMHAGWVAVIYPARKLTELSATGYRGGLVGTYDGIQGWLALAVFGMLALGCYCLWPQPRSDEAPGREPKRP